MTTRPPLSQATFELGKRVRAHRAAQDITQEELAFRSEVDCSFLGKVERGQRNLRLHNLLKIAGGLGIDPGELITGIAPPRKTEQSDHAR